MANRAPVAIGLLALVLSCAHGSAPARPPAAAPPAATGQGQVIVGPEAFAGGEGALAAWIAYGAAKAARYGQHPPPPANQSADDFALELGAREDQSELWASYRTKPDSKPNTELDRQVEIWRAGFLPELVVTIYARPGWTVPANAIAALRVDAFAHRFAGQYSPHVAVAVKPPSGKLFPDVPGDDFPDPDTLPYGPDSCGLALDARRAAWERWAALEPKLGGAPVSAGSTLDFGHQLTIMQRDPARVARGATWVSRRVAHLAALEGFCAIEARDWPRAQGFLARAVSLTPASPNPRLELSMALMMTGRRLEALAIADELRTWTDDGCAIAAAWRRRGYILVDLHDLEGARYAYEKSLVIDPGNPIATKELASIAEAMKEAPLQHAPPAAPPPEDAIRITRCTQGRPSGQ